MANDAWAGADAAALGEVWAPPANTVITAPPASATASALIPDVSIPIAAVPGSATASMPTPVFREAGVPASATASMPVPNIITTIGTPVLWPGEGFQEYGNAGLAATVLWPGDAYQEYGNAGFQPTVLWPGDGFQGYGNAGFQPYGFVEWQGWGVPLGGGRELMDGFQQYGNVAHPVQDVSGSITFGAAFNSFVGFIFDYVDANNYKEIAFGDASGFVNCYNGGVVTQSHGPAQLRATPNGSPQRITYNRVTGEFARYNNGTLDYTNVWTPATVPPGVTPRVGIVLYSQGGGDGTVQDFSSAAGFSDTFTRPDSASLGAPWVGFQNSIGVVSNSAKGGTTDPSSALVYYTSTGLLTGGSPGTYADAYQDGY